MAVVVRTPWTPTPDMAGAFSNAGIVYVLLFLDASYPAGGYPVSPKTFGLGTRILTFIPGSITDGPYFPVYDPTVGSLRLLNTSHSTAWTEVTAGTDLSTIQIDIGILGW